MKMTTNTNAIRFTEGDAQLLLTVSGELTELAGSVNEVLALLSKSEATLAGIKASTSELPNADYLSLFIDCMLDDKNVQIENYRAVEVQLRALAKQGYALAATASRLSKTPATTVAFDAKRARADYESFMRGVFKASNSYRAAASLAA